MNDHRLVQDLHAAISRRDWTSVEQAANRIRDDKEIKWPAPEQDASRVASPALASADTGAIFNELIKRINFDGMDPRTFSLVELERAIPGATLSKDPTADEKRALSTASLNKSDEPTFSPGEDFLDRYFPSLNNSISRGGA